MICGMPNRNRSRNWRRIRGDRLYNENADFRFLEKVFWHYKDIKNEVSQIRAEMGFYQSHKADGGASSNRAFISDPTASAAMKRAVEIPKVIINSGTLTEDVIQNPEKWLVVVEQTMLYMKNEELVGEVLRRRFFLNEPSPTTCIDLEINKNKYYVLRDVGLRFAKECAIQLGLIKVFFDEPYAKIREKNFPAKSTGEEQSDTI